MSWRSWAPSFRSRSPSPSLPVSSSAARCHLSPRSPVSLQRSQECTSSSRLSCGQDSIRASRCRICPCAARGCSQARNHDPGKRRDMGATTMSELGAGTKGETRSEARFFFQPRAETMPRDELAALQLERLRATVRNAYEHVPLHRKRLDDAGITPEAIGSLDDVC